VVVTPTPAWIPGPPIPYPIAESESYVISSATLSAMGTYKASDSFDMWDVAGQPSSIGDWADYQSPHVTGGGWAYTISLPIWWDKDHDQDGMPLSYEEQFSSQTGNTLNDYDALDAYGDYDGDGLTNIQEYLARTDPWDETSFLELSDIRLVTSGGDVALYWRDPTIRITGFDADYPDYLRSLAFDILYADWTTTQQAAEAFPNEDWFNQTGTWALLPGATGIVRSIGWNPGTDNTSAFTVFTDTTISALSTGDIRFYRIAVADTWLEGEPTQSAAESGSWTYYTRIGDPRVASTLAREVMMIQRHGLDADNIQLFSLAGKNPGGGGKLDYALGSNFFPAGILPPVATEVNLWNSQTNVLPATVDWMFSGGDWRDSDGAPSSRTLVQDDGFRFTFNQGLPSPAVLYLGAALNMDPFYHGISRRTTWTAHSGSPTDPNAALTLIGYNYPVEVTWPGGLAYFPSNLPGTDAPAVPFLIGFYSDWILFYNRSGGVRATVYYDHVDGRWEFLTPVSKWGQAAEDQINIQPGVAVVINQYWDPDDPVAWDSESRVVRGDVPYQNAGSTDLETYLKYE